VSSSATRELIRVQSQEFVRDGRYFYFALLFPFGMMAIFMGLGQITPTDPESGFGFGQIVVPMTVFLSVTSVAFMATAGPIATMRTKGTLRLLGTTPIGRTRLILTHMPARLGLVLFQVAVLLGVGVGLDMVEVGALPALAAITLLGLAMFGSLGYLLGGTLPSPETAANASTLIQLAALFLSGLVVPLSILPDNAARILSYLPTTFFADLLIAQMPGGEPTHSVGLSVLVVLATTAVIAVLAVYTFKWDQGEKH
jgi:ABC-2 type transport system permease protein